MDIQKWINLFSAIYKFEPYLIWIIAAASILVYFICTQFLKKTLLARKFLVIGTITSGVLMLILAIAYSVLQGLIWVSDPHSIIKTLTPPFTPFSYVFSYVWMHFLVNPVFCLLGAIGLFFLLKLVNKIGHNRFFYEEEYWLAALGGLAVGWPNLILYFFFAAFLNVFAHIIAMAIKKEGRISLLYMWPIAMIITIIFGNKLATLTGLIQLKP